MTDTKKLSIVPIKKANNKNKENMIECLELQIKRLKECEDAAFCFTVISYDKMQAATASNNDDPLSFRAMIGAIEDEKVCLISANSKETYTQR